LARASCSPLGHDLDILYTEGAGQTMQPVISGNIDIGVAVGTLGAFGAYAKGAPIRIIGAESTGEDAYWYVRADSPVKSMADMEGRSIAFSTVGASTHSHVLGYKVNARPVASGGFPATFTQVLSGQIDAGWSAPPYAFEALRKGEIRIIVRAAELPLVKDHTIRVLIANKDSLERKPEVFARFMALIAKRWTGCMRARRRPRYLRSLPASPSRTPGAFARSSIPRR